MYYKRTIEETITDMAKSFPCLVLYGPRQSGKSMTMDNIYQDFLHVSLDDSGDRALAKDNPKAFLDNYSWPVIIDEIQKAPNLLDEIKIRIDNQKRHWLKEDKPYKLMYILTCSNSFELQKREYESLAGRTGVLNMFSFSQAEKDQKKGSLFSPKIEVLKEKEKSSKPVPFTKRDIFDSIFEGGMPDIVTKKANREYFFKSYLNTYVEKDVRLLLSATHETSFRTFMEYLALRTAQELNYEVISRNVGIDIKTVKRWISLLETSGIIVLLRPYMARISNRIIKAPKLYFMDTGLCAYLCKWPSSEMLESCAMAGAFYETYVVSEIIKNLTAYAIDYRSYLYYYRDIDQKEIDLLYVDSQDIYPIEIKKGIAPCKPTKNFSVLSKYGKNIMPGLVIDSCDRIRPINDKAYYVPVSLLGV